MPGRRDRDHIKIIEDGNGARRNALLDQMRGKPIIAEQGSQQIGGYPGVAYSGYLAAFARQRSEKCPQPFSCGS